MSNASEQFIHRFFATWNRHSAEAMADFYHSEAVMEDPMLPNSIHGRDAIRDYYKRSFAATPNARHNLIRYVTPADRIHFEWDYVVDSLPPIREVTTFGASIFQLSNNSIIRDTSYWDPREFIAATRGAPLAGKRVLLLAAPLFEDLELYYPLVRLREAGAQVDVAGLDEDVYRGKFASLSLASRGRATIPGVEKPVYLGVNGMPVAADLMIRDVDSSRYHALVVPGGYAPDHLRRSKDVIRILQEFNHRSALIATICHGGWVLASADIASGRRLTGLSAIECDLRNAGAEFVDESVVVDGNLVSSRHPDDLPAFCGAIIEHLAKVSS